jgi:hypothetical protein
MFDDIVRYQSQWHFYALILIERCIKIHILDVGTTKFGIELLITLFHMIFDETILAVRVVSLYG